MGRPEVFIEHSQGTKRRKQLKVKPSQGDLYLIGSSREANLRIAGEEISGCHAALQYRDGQWFICDLSGNGIDGQKTERAIGSETFEVQLGQHRLKLFAKENNTDLFKSAASEGDLGLHQVVVRVKGRIVETLALKSTESYKLDLGLETKVMPAPTSGEWVITEIGNRTIQQRLVASQAAAEIAPIEIDQALAKPVKITTGILLLLLLLMIATHNFAPKTAEEANLTQQQVDMIFNAKVIKKKKEIVKQTGSKVKAGGDSENAPKSAARSTPEESQAPKMSAKATAALTSIRNAGLSALVGKIAKRANNKGIMVATSGVTADNANAGRAFYSTGTTTVGGGGSASKQGAYRLGGVGTQGKGGGAGNYKGGTALAGGSVGMGDVGVVDEETVIEGGLDRDVIAEVIKRNLGQIRYCYERQLSSDAKLYGKVMVNFSIGADGLVSAAQVGNTTMRNAMVEGCIVRRVAGFKFPLPKGGTTVKVSYPFLFKALD
jgi:outer membrane biosynthesis protein TonB